MLFSVAAVLAGFLLLIVAADRFVLGAASVAEHLGVPKLLVGLTVVGLGTSAPEMVVAAVASFNGQTGLALGNALGSNFTNIALVLGATAVIAPLLVVSSVTKRELPILMGVSVFVFLLCIDGALTRVDGVALLVALVIVMAWLAKLSKSGGSVLTADIEEGAAAELHGESHVLSMRASILWTLAGIIVLPAASQLLVWGASDIASAIGVSDLVIGLTIVAVGTSLPELAASVVSALKGEPDIAIGNVIGSNIFNLLGVVAMPALIAPGLIPQVALTRDFPIMLAITALLCVAAYVKAGKARIGRTEGVVLLLGFVAYQAVLFAYG